VAGGERHDDFAGSGTARPRGWLRARRATQGTRV